MNKKNQADFVGMTMVGDKGPELEVVDPHAQSKLDELIAEVRGLRLETAANLEKLISISALPARSPDIL